MYFFLSFKNIITSTVSQEWEFTNLSHLQLNNSHNKKKM